VTRPAARSWRRGGELGEVRLNRDFAGGELPLIDVEEFEILLEDENVFRAIVARQGCHDLGLRRAAPIVTMLGELMRIAVAGDDVAEDPEAGHARDVADD
jgi:hypothetical protein